MSHRRVLSALVVAVVAGCSNSSFGGGVVPGAQPGAKPPEAQGSKKTKFTVLTAFQQSQFQRPVANVTFDGSGTIWGTASYGVSPYNCGGVFKIDANGNESDFYGFDGSNACGPDGAVAFDASGNIFGTTSGAVYEITKSGHEHEIEALKGGPEGGFALTNLVSDKAGNFYGTASEGGYFKGICGSYPPVGCGVVFKVTPSGRYTVIHKFRNTDGDRPEAGLTFGKDGNLYGTTMFGGPVGWGEVYRMTTSGKVTVLYGFKKSNDGGMPQSTVSLDSAGNMYGTASEGGWNGNQQCDSGCGVVFKVTPSGEESVLHAFTASPDGQFPLAGLYLDSHGILYGTTQEGGKTFGGTAFELTTSGKQYRILHNFSLKADGGDPVAALVPDTAGNLYGTSEGGGIGAGTVFKITP